ncbi:MAG: putative aminohydrolase SsnA [Anaerolineae bacterium]|nr:putative aminohydrolase SsnA [Anaerolineae bacterium]
MALLITNATVVTGEQPNRLLPDHALLVKHGIIRAVDTTAALRAQYPEARVLDAAGQYVLPGNICAHTHFYGAYARGMAIPGAPAASFPEILRRLWWPLDQALDRDSVRASALVCLVDAIKHGTTALIDHHASPNFIAGSLDVIAAAVNQAGLRAVLCYEVTDRNGMEQMHAGIAENVRFMQTRHERIAGTFGLHASLTLNDEALHACAAALPAGAGVHVHVAEHEADEEDSLRRSGRRVVPRLEAFGLWNERSIAAHCVHVDAAEREILRRRGVWVTHQPRSNMNNAVGAADVDGMLREGLRLCLGNDGFSNAMWTEWKAAYLLHKVIHRDPRRANGADIFHMATVNNARLLEQFFPQQQIGTLAVGAQADLIFVDYKPFTPVTAGNLPWHILFGFEPSMVTTTIVDGVILMQDRQLLTLNEADIMAEALALAPAVWERYTRYAQNALQD